MSRSEKKSFLPIYSQRDGMEVGGNLQKVSYARNYMKLPDLHRKVMFTAPIPMVWGQRVEVQIQIFFHIEKSCLQIPTPGVGLNFQKDFFARD